MYDIMKAFGVLLVMLLIFLYILLECLCSSSFVIIFTVIAFLSIVVVFHVIADFDQK